MYSRISIRNFRGIDSLDASGFRRINLILGHNNSGKTTFLEGIFLLSGATNVLYPATLGQLRGQRLTSTYPDPIWRALFYNSDPERSVEIEGQWAVETDVRRLEIRALGISNYVEPLETGWEGKSDTPAVTQDRVITWLQLRYTGPEGGEITVGSTVDPYSGKIQVDNMAPWASIPSRFLPARSYASPERIARDFSSLVKSKQDSDVMDALRIIEPKVRRIEVLAEPSGPSIYLDLGLNALTPLNVCGEGMVRLFSTILELIGARDGVLLIDEIDSGLHYSVMPRLWKLLGALVEKYNVQVFGTTHNDDIIRSALEAFADDEGMLGLFRVDKRADRHAMVAYSEEAMKGVLEAHFEVRG
jgi:AAA domain, putative AbiEii toxin, Type IV TA system/AAA ATPase domain